MSLNCQRHALCKAMMSLLLMRYGKGCCNIFVRLSPSILSTRETHPSFDLSVTATIHPLLKLKMRSIILKSSFQWSMEKQKKSLTSFVVTTGLVGALHALDMQFGYQQTDVQHKLTEISTRPQVEMSMEGMRELLNDLSASYVKASFRQLNLRELLNRSEFLTAFTKRIPKK